MFLFKTCKEGVSSKSNHAYQSGRKNFVKRATNLRLKISRGVSFIVPSSVGQKNGVIKKTKNSGKSVGDVTG